MAPGSQHIGTTPWKEAQKYGVDIIGDLNQHTQGWIEWNVLLDSTGGPTCIGPTATEQCTPLAGHCDAPILADVAKQQLEYRDSYYIMAHFSRYLPRGSVVVDISTNATSSPLLYTAAIVGLDELVVVVQNTHPSSQPYQLQIRAQSSSAAAPELYIPIDSMTERGIHTVRVQLPAEFRHGLLGS